MSIDDVLSSRAIWYLEEGDSASIVLPPDSIDAIVTDPPSGISFMGKEWDSDRGGEEQWIAWLTAVLGVGFAALKPGAHALVWALPRTGDWTMRAIRGAGFEIRDVITHAFGQGFPKNFDISKGIDNAAGIERRIVGERTFTGTAALTTEQKGGTYSAGISSVGVPARSVPITEPATDEARQWLGYGTALKPASEWWILARKPFRGSVTRNVLRYGTGALNIDAARVMTSDDRSRSQGDSDRRSGVFDQGLGMRHRPTIARETSGRWPANLVLSHAPQCERVGLRRVRSGVTVEPAGESDRSVTVAPAKYLGRVTGYGIEGKGTEEIEAWECLATCQCGRSVLASTGGPPPRCGCGADMMWACPVAFVDEQSDGASNDCGGGSRYFHRFDPDPVYYVPKPATAEKDAGAEAIPKAPARSHMNSHNGAGERVDGAATAQRSNIHPTVKGKALIAHLLDLVLPRGGVVLDLFAGSGTTLAVVAERHPVTQWRAIGCEIDPDYAAIARARARHWESAGREAYERARRQLDLFPEPEPEEPQETSPFVARQTTFFW